MTDDLRGERPRAVIADELLRTPADVLRRLTEAAHRGEPFTIAGVTYVPQQQLDDLREQVELVCHLGYRGLVPARKLRDVLAGRSPL